MREVGKIPEFKDAIGCSRLFLFVGFSNKISYGATFSVYLCHILLDVCSILYRTCIFVVVELNWIQMFAKVP